MNVKELNEKYQRIQNWQDEYRKELISYINEAFAMHGNEFVLKPEGYDSWEEADEEEEGLDVSAHFGTYFELEDRHGYTHEIYPTRIYRKKPGNALTDYVDGYDLNEGEFVEGWYLNCDVESLSSIAWFINAVLEQEQELEWIKVGAKCKWNDPAIDDYPEEYQEEQLNIVWTIEQINGEVILISTDGGEAEVFSSEIEPA